MKRFMVDDDDSSFLPTFVNDLLSVSIFELGLKTIRSDTFFVIFHIFSLNCNQITSPLEGF